MCLRIPVNVATVSFGYTHRLLLCVHECMQHVTTALHMLGWLDAGMVIGSSFLYRRILTQSWGLHNHSYFFSPHGAACFVNYPHNTFSPSCSELYNNRCHECETVCVQLWLVTPTAVGLWVGKTLGKLPLSFWLVEQDTTQQHSGTLSVSHILLLSKSS